MLHVYVKHVYKAKAKEAIREYQWSIKRGSPFPSPIGGTVVNIQAYEEELEWILKHCPNLEYKKFGEDVVMWGEEQAIELFGRLHDVWRKEQGKDQSDDKE